jgi:histidinol dehydrogenase
MRIARLGFDGADAAALAADIRARSQPTTEAAEPVRELLERVREGGEEVVRELSRAFGDVLPDSLRVDPEEVRLAPAQLDDAVREALAVAAANISRVASAELMRLTTPSAYELDEGQRIEVRASPVAAAGIYAPGGRASYPSSVLMSALPARIAGVPRVAVVSPPNSQGRVDQVVLAACAIAAVDEVYALGGPQAIAALAYGIESVPAVDVIAGPGNRFVTEAKRQVAGVVAIDGLAGPSELAVVADSTANVDWLCLDLCAQAEHGPDSPLIVISTTEDLLDRIEQRIGEMAAERPSVTDASLALVFSPGILNALALADAYAAEHLELAFAGADEAIARERVAGCVFVGRGAATAFGDYAAGSNHVLPTGGAARFSGPLGPGAFMRRTSVVSLDAVAARQLAPVVAAIADAEGLPVHGESALARVEGSQ